MMFTLGMLVGFFLFGAAFLWYRQPNSRFSSRILGFDLGSTDPDAPYLPSGGPRDLSRLLRAWRRPSEDQGAERDRRLMTNRFRILVGLLPVFAVLPILFDLIGRIIPIFLGGGLVGLGLLVVALSILIYRAMIVGQVVVAYGEGHRLDRRRLALSLLGFATGIGVLLAILIVST
jgi:hypothetical protein